MALYPNLRIGFTGAITFRDPPNAGGGPRAQIRGRSGRLRRAAGKLWVWGRDVGQGRQSKWDFMLGGSRLFFSCRGSI